MKKIIFYISLFVSQYVLGSVFSLPVQKSTNPHHNIENFSDYIGIDILGAHCCLGFPKNGIQPRKLVCIQVQGILEIKEMMQ